LHSELTAGDEGNMMRSRVRTAAPFLFLILFLCFSSQLTAQASADDAPRHRWLECDGSWLIGDHLYMASDFIVRLHYHKQGIPGTKILLSVSPKSGNVFSGRIVATAETDSDGIAHFVAIPEGLYEVRPDAELLIPHEEVEVEANRVQNENENVDLEWPLWSTVTRNLQGSITVWDHSKTDGEAVRNSLQNVQLELFDLRTAKLVGQTATDDQGRYSFPSLPDALYVIRVDADQDPKAHEYERAVEISSTAKRRNMPRLEVDKTCGNGLSELVTPRKTTQSSDFLPVVQ
jgi:hypothetical protein